MLAQKPDRLAEFELTSPIDGMVMGIEVESVETHGQPKSAPC